ncbi:phosphate ABC transporter substrate-binding protein [Hassallia byssoidea VB512170]|uniref:Phosphate ABC transporter substrate-binding protein n=1 Tax=Hassallia byssoidea VB512170 TaxID=1304833 RepID=A0A846H9S2_9CYAN|nr:substrate-binding domain-containing protein [Hassalia byssoidea]NEU74122.1 phosphate ABC transporter substrate-binding protein [Hassalia byssoidea VB512170]
MKNTSKKIPLSKDAQQMIRGLIFGELITIVIIGGLWLWLRPRLWVNNGTFSSSGQDANTASSTANSNFQTVTDVPIGAFKYGGSTTWAPIRQLVDSYIQNTRPELQLQYVDPPNGSPGSGAGIKMLLDGKLDFAESSRPLTDEEYAIAKQRGFTLEQREIATDGVAVAVNQALNLPGLTVEQLKQIYSGQITNFKQVDGPDLAIIPLSQQPENADTVLFSDKPLKQALGSNVQYVYSTTEALRRVSKTPGAVYYGSARSVVPQCTVKALPLGRVSTQLISPYREPLIPSNQCPQKRNQVNTEVLNNDSYPIKSKLFVIVKKNKGREEKVGEAYTRLLLTDQGKKAIAQAGFIP